MKKLFGTIGCILVSALLLALPASSDTVANRHYQNYRVAVYITVDSTIRLADPYTRAREFDKVPVKVYRNRQFATDAQISGAERSYTRKINADVVAYFHWRGHGLVSAGRWFAAPSAQWACH